MTLRQATSYRTSKRVLHTMKCQDCEVVVEETENIQAQEVESSRLVPTPTPTTFTRSALAQRQPEPTILRIRDDNDRDSDDDRHGPKVVRMDLGDSYGGLQLTVLVDTHCCRWCATNRCSCRERPKGDGSGNPPTTTQ